MVQVFKASVDWDKGLPPDVLGLVAKAGGVPEMKAMRGVSHSWQQGFELGVGGVIIRMAKRQVPPLREVTVQRFPGLTHLDLAERSVPEAWLQNLRAFPKLKSLALGFPSNRGGTASMLGACLTDAGLGLLRGLPLTSLRLSRCCLLTDFEALRGMPLAILDVSTTGGYSCLTPTALDCLRGLPLTQLRLRWCRMQDYGYLYGLRGKPLTSLDLGWLTWGRRNVPADELLGILCGMPLTRLWLKGWSMTNDGLKHLQGMPLKFLDLGLCENLENLDPLRGMPLTVLGAQGCERLSNAALVTLRGMPITSLDLQWSPWLTEFGLLHLLELPLKHLNVTGCRGLSDDAKVQLRQAFTSVHF